MFNPCAMIDPINPILSCGSTLAKLLKIPCFLGKKNAVVIKMAVALYASQVGSWAFHECSTGYQKGLKALTTAPEGLWQPFDYCRLPRQDVSPFF
jgi:hypothetical protein